MDDPDLKKILKELEQQRQKLDRIALRTSIVAGFVALLAGAAFALIAAHYHF
jgi:hypothetical protein